MATRVDIWSLYMYNYTQRKVREKVKATELASMKASGRSYRKLCCAFILIRNIEIYLYKLMKTQSSF